MGETAKRILSAAFLVGFVIAALTWKEWAYGLLPLVLVLVFAIAATYEFYHITDRGLEGRAVRWAGYVGGVGLLLSFFAEATIGSGLAGSLTPYLTWFYPGRSILVLWLVLVTLLALAVHLIARPIDGTIYGISVTVAGVAYTAFSLGHAFPLIFQEAGTFYLLLIAAVTFMTDTGAYFAGRWFGKHNAGLKVSPRKTYEGYVGGYVVGALSALGMYHYFRYQGGQAATGLFQSQLEVVVFALLFSTLSILGDLAESAIKRDARIKDSASIIPGHGGILDLIDALLVTLPAGYYYILFKARLF